MRPFDRCTNFFDEIKKIVDVVIIQDTERHFQNSEKIGEEVKKSYSL